MNRNIYYIQEWRNAFRYYKYLSRHTEPPLNAFVHGISMTLTTTTEIRRALEKNEVAANKLERVSPRSPHVDRTTAAVQEKVQDGLWEIQLWNDLLEEMSVEAHEVTAHSNPALKCQRERFLEAAEKGCPRLSLKSCRVDSARPLVARRR